MNPAPPVTRILLSDVSWANSVPNLQRRKRVFDLLLERSHFNRVIGSPDKIWHGSSGSQCSGTECAALANAQALVDTQQRLTAALNKRAIQVKDFPTTLPARCSAGMSRGALVVEDP